MKILHKKYKSQGTIEFLIVFILLFILFIGVVDIALFFRQIYLVQTLSDEVLARLQTARACYENLDDTTEIIADTVSYYYGSAPVLTNSKSGSVYIFYNDKYNFSLTCRNEKTPDSLEFKYVYSGLLFLKGSRTISSDFSANTLYF